MYRDKLAETMLAECSLLMRACGTASPACIHDAHSYVCLCMQDDATVQELSTEDVANNMKGWVQQANTWLFHRNLYAGVPADETLLRIHSTAEEFDASAEALLIPFQVCICPYTGHIRAGA